MPQMGSNRSQNVGMKDPQRVSNLRKFTNNYFPGLEPSPLDPYEIQHQCHAHQFQSLGMPHQDTEKKVKKIIKCYSNHQ